MAVYMDWPNRIIHVPRADLELVQANPIEIRDMDLNWFRMQLKGLEDDPAGMMFPDTHRHNTEVTLGSLTFARIIEIINNYTVTFENGQYAVNLVGANSNVGDRVNVNQVSVRSANSAGMTSSPAIEHASYENQVTIDVNSPDSGTMYPIGTGRRPVNNLESALQIAVYRGFENIHLKSNLTITTGQVIDGYHVNSDSQDIEITLDPGSSCVNTTFANISIHGTMSGTWNIFYDCWLHIVNNFAGWMRGGSFEEITLAPYNEDSLGQSFLDNIVPFYTATDMVVITNEGTAVAYTGINGYFRLENLVEGAIATIGMASGTVTLAESCTGGNADVSGNGILVDNTTGTVVDSRGFMNTMTIATAVENEIGGEIQTLLQDVAFIKGIEGGKWEILENQMIFYDTNDVEIARFDLLGINGDPAMGESVVKRVRVL